MTVTIQIGNSDDKLTQVEWSEFVNYFNECINKFISLIDNRHIHFFGMPPGDAPWQNACWVLELHNLDKGANVEIIKQELRAIAKTYNQNCFAWTEGETEFV